MTAQPDDDMIRSVESFLGQAQGVDQATKDAAMRGLGRMIGLFFLGIMDTGVDQQVAIYETAAYIKVMVETYKAG